MYFANFAQSNLQNIADIIAKNNNKHTLLNGKTITHSTRNAIDTDSIHNAICSDG